MHDPSRMHPCLYAMLACRLDGRIYAIKKIRLDARMPGAFNRITREAAALSRMQHPNVVRYFQASKSIRCTRACTIHPPLLSLFFFPCSCLKLPTLDAQLRVCWCKDIPVCTTHTYKCRYLSATVCKYSNCCWCHPSHLLHTWLAP